MSSPPQQAAFPAPRGGYLRTGVQREEQQPVVQVTSLDASPDTLLRQLDNPILHSTTATPSDQLPTPSLDALADMDLTALRQLALQRGDQVSAAFQAFREARNSNQTRQRREYLDRVWDEMDVELEEEEEEEQEERDWALDEWADQPARDWAGAMDDEGDEDMEQDDEGMDIFPSYHDGLFSEEDSLDYQARTGRTPHHLDWTALAEDVDSSFWPGLLSTHPLNPRPRPSPPPIAATVHPSFFPSPHATSSLPPSSRRADPPSSQSPTSFLRPGMVFTGHQSFERRRSTARPAPPPAFASSSASISALDPYATLYPNAGEGGGGAREYGITPAPPPGFPSLPRSSAPWSSHLSTLDTPLVRDLAAPLQHLSAPTSSSALDMHAGASEGERRTTVTSLIQRARERARERAERETMADRARMDRLEGIQVGAEELEREVELARRRVAGEGSGAMDDGDGGVNTDSPSAEEQRAERSRAAERMREVFWDEEAGAHVREGRRGGAQWRMNRLLFGDDAVAEEMADQLLEKGEGEQWGVKVRLSFFFALCLALALTELAREQVIIHSYSSTTPSCCLTGLMHAVGVPSSPSPPSPSTASFADLTSTAAARETKDITTFFTGALISFSPPSSSSSSGEPLLPPAPPSGSRASLAQHFKQSTLEAEYWTKLGPFRSRGVTREELKARVGSGTEGERWLNEVTSGWVLMRWKERDFVNVARGSLSLSPPSVPSFPPSPFFS